MDRISGEDETAFVAAYWDERWSDADLAGDAGRVAGTDEFAFLTAVEPRLAGGGLDVLDCGCGRGDWTRFLRSRGHRAVGVDIAPRVMARLREKWPEWYRIGDFRQAPFPDASFDLVINWGGIEHFEEGPHASLVEAHRLLRTGGRAVVSTLCHNARGKLREALGLQPRAREARPGQRFYLERAGFAGLRTCTIGGEQGMSRVLEHELKWLGRLLPGRLRRGVARAAGGLLRPLVGHMVIASGTKLGTTPGQ